MTNHASKIIDALTVKTIVDNTGLTERNVRHAKSTGKFSARWFQVLRDLCIEHGVYCPEDAFSWVEPLDRPAKKIGTKVNKVKGAA